jgi:hypothetical protein
VNTPAHVALNALVLGHGRWQQHWLAITTGALLPDLPMVGFYLLERMGRGTPERVIWGQLYFEPGWQSFFDAFNSLPLIALAAFFAWRSGATAALACLAFLGFELALLVAAPFVLRRRSPAWGRIGWATLGLSFAFAAFAALAWAG